MHSKLFNNSHLQFLNSFFKDNNRTAYFQSAISTQTHTIREFKSDFLFKFHGTIENKQNTLSKCLIASHHCSLRSTHFQCSTFATIAKIIFAALKMFQLDWRFTQYDEYRKTVVQKQSAFHITYYNMYVTCMVSFQVSILQNGMFGFFTIQSQIIAPSCVQYTVYFVAYI